MSRVSGLFKDLTTVKEGKKRKTCKLGSERKKSGLLGDTGRSKVNVH